MDASLKSHETWSATTTAKSRMRRVVEGGKMCSEDVGRLEILFVLVSQNAYLGTDTARKTSLAASTLVASLRRQKGDDVRKAVWFFGLRMVQDPGLQPAVLETPPSAKSLSCSGPHLPRSARGKPSMFVVVQSATIRFQRGRACCLTLQKPTERNPHRIHSETFVFGIHWQQ